MTEKPANRGRRTTRGLLPVGPIAATRYGATATFIALILTINAASAGGASGLVAFPTGSFEGAGNGSERFLAPLLQSTIDTAALEPPPSSDAISDASRMAAIVAVVNRQGVVGPLVLQRVSPVAVSNQMVKPALVVDARAKRTAEAEAAAAEIALTVQATVEAQEAEAANKAAALAAEQEAEADAAASATAEAVATESARNNAAEAAATLSKQKQEARVRAAEEAATQNVANVAAVAVVSDPKSPDRTSFLLIAAAPLLGGILGKRSVCAAIDQRST
jgi:hypothetical protein